MNDGLRDLRFKEAASGESNFIKFVADVPVKLRVFTTNPTIHVNKYGKEQYSFAVWNYNDEKAMILSKGVSIAKGIANLHNDEDFGADITKIDIKILPTGEQMDREYAINVLPKTLPVSKDQEAALKELDEKLPVILKTAVRATDYNNGMRPEAMESEDPTVDLTEIFPDKE